MCIRQKEIETRKVDKGLLSDKMYYYKTKATSKALRLFVEG